MPHLAGKHGNFPAMVSVMGDELREKGDCVGTKTFDAAVGRDGSAHDYAESFAALFHGPQSLRRGDLGTIELIGYLAALGCRGKPYNTYIVHMGHDRLNGTAFALRRTCLPSGRRKMVDEKAIDPVIGVEGVEQGRRECGGERVLHGEIQKNRSLRTARGRVIWCADLPFS